MNNRCLILLFIAAMIGFASCKNNDNVFKRVLPSSINVVNASADTLNIYLNGTRQNNNSSLFPGGQSFYLTVPSGMQNYQFKKAGNSAVLFSVPLTLIDSTFTSLYVYGGSVSQTFTTNDPLAFVQGHQDTTQVRFVNVSPDAGSLNVTVGSTISFTSQAFKSATAFALFNGGQQEVKIFLPGAATPRVDTLITFQPGSIYTLFSRKG